MTSSCFCFFQDQLVQNFIHSLLNTVLWVDNNAGFFWTQKQQQQLYQPAQSPLSRLTVGRITLRSKEWMPLSTSLIRLYFKLSGSRESRKSGR